jgi:hypothetical protein
LGGGGEAGVGVEDAVVGLGGVSLEVGFREGRGRKGSGYKEWGIGMEGERSRGRTGMIVSFLRLRLDVV